MTANKEREKAFTYLLRCTKPLDWPNRGLVMGMSFQTIKVYLLQHAEHETRRERVRQNAQIRKSRGARRRRGDYQIESFHQLRVNTNAYET